jgi:hypothetical protein
MTRNRLLRWGVLSVICVISASWLFSLALEVGWLRHSLSTKLAASFGRPVEVAHFGFSIIGGPQVEADSITIGEDPRFGQEYFLRAERLAARLRWAALLRGRIEFDRLLVTHPSLNLVRAADGLWNVQTWLPPSNDELSAVSHRAPSNAPAYASRIAIDGGRINFKRGTDKLPFAFLDVSGSLNLQRDGRWSLDLEAHPMRAAVMLQSPGILHVRGTVGGTSTRLQPADLKLSWEGASLADAARLARGTDYGLRGLFDADFAVRFDRADGNRMSSPWNIDGGIRLRAVHRWDLAARPDNPAVNLKVRALWYPVESRIEIGQWLAETPRSNLNGDGSFDWSHGFDPDVRLLGSRINFADLINWARGFIPGRADDLDVSGNFGLEARFAGWPLRIQDLRLEGAGATLRAEGKFNPIRIGPLRAVWSHSSLVLAPVTVSLSSASQKRSPRAAQAKATESLFRVDGVVGPISRDGGLRDSPYKLVISGQTARLQDLRAAVVALGWEFAPNWSAEGAASLLVIYAGALRPGTSSAHAQLQFHDLRIAGAAFNEPIVVPQAIVEFSPAERRVQIMGARAVGATWDGVFERKNTNPDWAFDLSTERVNLSELGQELAQNRQTLLYRLLPFAGSAGLAPEAEAAIRPISAQGHVHIHELQLAALRLEDVDATAELAHGSLLLQRAQADFYGGRVSGEFRAELGRELRYSFRGQVDRTDLSALAGLTSMKSGFGGIASGELDLSGRGMSWQPLMDSLQGEGFLHIEDATAGILDLRVESADAEIPRIAGNRFRSSTVSFRVENGHIRVDPWLLSGRRRQVEIVGDVEFNRRINLQVRSASSAERLGPGSDAADDLWVVGGTLDSPQIIRDEHVTAGNETAVRPGR